MTEQSFVSADEVAALKNTTSISGNEIDSPNTFAVYSNPVRAEKKRLENGIRFSFSLGRKAAISMFKYMLEIYKNREELLKGNSRHLKSFALYLIDTFPEMPSSTAYNNAKVVEMLSKHKHDVLSQYADLSDLIKQVRMIADAPVKSQDDLLGKIESFDRDELAVEISKARSKNGKKGKQTSEVVKKSAEWDESVATSFNSKKGSLKLEYTGESKDEAAKYFELIQKLVLEKDKNEVMAFLGIEESEDEAVANSDDSSIEETVTEDDASKEEDSEETTIDGVPVSEAPKLI